MIVDFIGMPGAGKSTLALATAARLRAGGVDVAAGENDGASAADGRRLGASEARRFRVAAIVGNPLLAATCATELLRPGGRRYLAMMVNLCRRDWALRQAEPTGLLLLYESSLHRLCVGLAVMERSSAEVVERFLRRLAWPDALVHVAVEPRLAYARVHERLTELSVEHVMAPVADEVDVRWRERYAAAAEHVVRVVEPRRPVLRLDGTLEVSALAVAVEQWVRELESVRRPARRKRPSGGRGEGPRVVGDALGDDR